MYMKKTKKLVCVLSVLAMAAGLFASLPMVSAETTVTNYDYANAGWDLVYPEQADVNKDAGTGSKIQTVMRNNVTYTAKGDSTAEVTVVPSNFGAAHSTLNCFNDVMSCGFEFSVGDLTGDPEALYIGFRSSNLIEKSITRSLLQLQRGSGFKIDLKNKKISYHRLWNSQYFGVSENKNWWTMAPGATHYTAYNLWDDSQVGDSLDFDLTKKHYISFVYCTGATVDGFSGAVFQICIDGTPVDDFLMSWTPGADGKHYLDDFHPVLQGKDGEANKSIQVWFGLNNQDPTAAMTLTQTAKVTVTRWNTASQNLRKQLEAMYFDTKNTYFPGDNINATATSYTNDAHMDGIGKATQQNLINNWAAALNALGTYSQTTKNTAVTFSNYSIAHIYNAYSALSWNKGQADKAANTVKAKAPDVLGAQIRESDNALRFVLAVEQSELDYLNANYDSVEFGTVLVNNSKFTGATLAVTDKASGFGSATATTVKNTSAFVPASFTGTSYEGQKVFTCVVENVNTDAKRATEIAVRSYVKVTKGDTTKVFYSTDSASNGGYVTTYNAIAAASAEA